MRGWRKDREPVGEALWEMKGDKENPNGQPSWSVSSDLDVCGCLLRTCNVDHFAVSPLKSVVKSVF